VRESVELLILSENWQVETFASAEEFLSQPRRAPPSCLLLDLALPNLNGMELQKRLGDPHAFATPTPAVAARHVG
jgi:FixJ family two-component response regulator